MKKLSAMVLMMSLLLVLVLCGASAEGGWADYTCEEQSFSTKIPLSGTSGYDEQSKGLKIYTDVPGYIPYVVVSRRPMDMKFSNPENYLNNVYREYIENSYGDDCLGMNPAKTWEIGGKELIGAKYMFKIGDTTVIQLQLIEVRPDGDVEYTVKYIDGEGEATLAAAEEAVRNYQETDITILPVSEEPDQDQAATGTSENTAGDDVPPFMTPSVFVERFNTMMGALADKYADSLGEENVKIIKESYTLTQEDLQGSFVYYDNNDWTLEAGFVFEDPIDYLANAPALVLNFSIRKETPEVAAYFAKYGLQMMIGYDFQDDVNLDDLAAWFDTADDPANVFELPGYTLNVVVTDDRTQYMILPPPDQNPLLKNVDP